MKSSARPLASVVIVNRDGGDMVVEAVRSVLAQSILPDLEVLVVDNASSDGSPDLLESLFAPRVKVLRSDVNLGFAAGNNLAFRHALGRYLLLLNNDAVAHPAWAEELLNVMESSPSVAMCASKILCHADPRVIDNVGHRIYVDGLNRSRGHLETDAGQYDRLEEVLFASGCAAAYRRDLVLDLGGFCESFFAYGDDADLGLRLRLRGLKCIYVPTAVVHHRQSATARPFSLQKLYWIERNRIWVMIRLLPASWILLSPVYTFCRLFQAWLAARERSGVAASLLERHSSPAIALLLFRAWWAAALELPRRLHERRLLMTRQRALTPGQWRLTLDRFRASHREMAFG